MINPGYNIDAEDYTKLESLRVSHVYGSYLKAIAHSPAFKSIMKIHIDQVNITEDLKKMKQRGQIPEGVSTDALNQLFRQSLSSMAIGLVADTILLKELEDVNVDEIVSGLKKDSNISYLLGVADKKFYSQAAELLDKGEIDEGTLEFRGLTAYLKRNTSLNEDKSNVQETLLPSLVKATTKPKAAKKSGKSAVDLSSDSIRI